MTWEQTRAVRYLLGTLPEQEADALGEEMFSRDATFSELEEAENLLVEAYLDGELSPDDRQRFEALVGASSHMNERVELERTLRSQFGRPKAAPRRTQVWLPWAAALVFGATGGGLALQANRAADRERAAGALRVAELEQRAVEQEKRVRELEDRLADREGPAPVPTPVTWRLAGGAQRGEAVGAPEFAPTNRQVRVRVPDAVPANASYSARFCLPGDDLVVRLDGVTPVAERDGAFLHVLVPGSLLPHGTYLLYLEREGTAGPRELGPYSISVQR